MLALSIAGLAASVSGLGAYVISYRTRLHNARHALRSF